MSVRDLPLGHAVVVLRDAGPDGCWWGLSFPDAPKASDRGPFMSGPLDADFPGQLRALADASEAILEGQG